MNPHIIFKDGVACVIPQMPEQEFCYGCVMPDRKCTCSETFQKALDLAKQNAIPVAEEFQEEVKMELYASITTRSNAIDKTYPDYSDWSAEQGKVYPPLGVEFEIESHCTKQNCNCIDAEMKRLDSEAIKNYPCIGKVAVLVKEETEPKGFVDWNQYNLDQLVNHLKNEFGGKSSGTSLAISKLIRFYESHKEEPKEESQAELWDEAFTNSPVRIHPKTEEFLKSKFRIERIN